MDILNEFLPRPLQALIVDYLSNSLYHLIEYDLSSWHLKRLIKLYGNILELKEYGSSTLDKITIFEKLCRHSKKVNAIKMTYKMFFDQHHLNKYQIYDIFRFCCRSDHLPLVEWVTKKIKNFDEIFDDTDTNGIFITIMAGKRNNDIILFVIDIFHLTMRECLGLVNNVNHVSLLMNRLIENDMIDVIIQLLNKYYPDVKNIPYTYIRSLWRAACIFGSCKVCIYLYDLKRLAEMDIINEFETVCRLYKVELIQLFVEKFNIFKIIQERNKSIC